MVITMIIVITITYTTISSSFFLVSYFDLFVAFFKRHYDYGHIAIFILCLKLN